MKIHWCRKSTHVEPDLVFLRGVTRTVAAHIFRGDGYVNDGLGYDSNDVLDVDCALVGGGGDAEDCDSWRNFTLNNQGKKRDASAISYKVPVPVKIYGKVYFPSMTTKSGKCIGLHGNNNAVSCSVVEVNRA